MLPWIVAALVLSGVGIALTVGIHGPLNDALAAVGSSDRIADLAQVRASFEAAWIRWNIARAVAFTMAFQLPHLGVDDLRAHSCRNVIGAGEPSTIMQTGAAPL